MGEGRWWIVAFLTSAFSARQTYHVETCAEITEGFERTFTNPGPTEKSIIFTIIKFA
jgi:hypothetical protein